MTRKTFLLLVVEEKDESPTRTVDTTGESVEDEPSRIVARNLAKCGKVVELASRRAARG
jgi:hypothetical protein